MAQSAKIFRLFSKRGQVELPHGIFFNLLSIIGSFYADNLFDSPDCTAFQADFDAMGMGWGFCQDIFYNSFCEFPRSLILF